MEPDELRTLDVDRAAAGRPEPRDRLCELALAVPRDPRDPHDFAAAHLEAQAADGVDAAVALHREVAHDQPRVTAAVPGGRLLRRQLVADHHLGEAVVRDLGRHHRPDLAPVPEHCDPVRELEDLADLVGDEDEAPAVGDHLPEHGEEIVDLLRRQHRGRLVEDQQRDVAVERLDDLDALPLTDRELPDQRLRVDA